MMLLMLGVILLLLSLILYRQEPRRMNLEDNLGRIVLKVDDTDYTLRELLFYIAHEEYEVEEQAKVYSPEDTNSYWNLHTNGQFIKEAAKQAALEQAIHDALFYKIATREDSVTLTGQEKEELRMRQEDFWSDLSTQAQQRLQAEKEQLMLTMEQLALAEKAQRITAEKNGMAYEAYSIDGEAYQDLKKEHMYKSTDVWEKLEFGNLTITH